MKGVFKITRAEFIKIFKKPIVYIMAFVLALVSVLSIILIKPQIRSQNPVTMNADNASGCYAIFNGNSEVSKQEFDKTFDKTDEKVKLYNSLLTRYNNIDKALDTFKDNFITVKNYNGKGEKTEAGVIADCNKAFEDLLNVFKDISDLTQYASLNVILSAENDDNKPYYLVHTIDTENFYSCEYFETSLSANLKNVTNAKNYTTFIENNNYINLLEHLCSYGKDLIRYNLLDMQSSLKSQKNKFIDIMSKSQSSDQQEQSSQALEKLLLSVKQFKEKVDIALQGESLLIFSTNSDYKKFANYCDDIIKTINSAKTSSSGQYTQTNKYDCAEKLKKSVAFDGIENYIKSLSFLSVNEDLKTELTKIQEKVNKNKETILKNIDSLSTETSTRNIINEITNYRCLAETYSDVTMQIVIKQLAQKVDVSKIRDGRSETITLTSYNTYENLQNISQNKYQIDNNIYSYSLGQVFNFGGTSGYKTSMYDCIYTTLKIGTIVIILFTIMMISGLVTSETENGTIKLLLIRPYRRSKILVGKMLATLFFSLVFILFTVLLSGVMGYFMFGMPTFSSILVTFNSNITFTTSPIVLILIFMGSCILDIVFYLILSLTVSVLFRSYIGAITTSILIYIGGTILGAFIPSSTLYAYLPFTNTGLFRFFGGELLMSNTSKVALLLSTPVQSSQTFYSSLLITAITSVVLLGITLFTFNRRDF